MTHYHLAHRAIIRLSGEAPIAFLHDILTADVASLSTGQMRQSCLLSPQGRILVEMGIYHPEQDGNGEIIYIACDARQSDELIKKLKLYRLRRKIVIEACDDLCLIATDQETQLTDALIQAPDERAPHRGYHAIIPYQALGALALGDLDVFVARRLSDAIPEGPDELTPNRALMLEAGLDLFKALDFKKGCYIGQEVTARMRYRGLVKRRLIPVRASALIAQTTLIQDDKEVGTIVATAPAADGQTIGLASLRLAAIHQTEDGSALYHDGNPISLAIPQHLRPLPKQDTKSKA